MVKTTTTLAAATVLAGSFCPTRCFGSNNLSAPIEGGGLLNRISPFRRRGKVKEHGCFGTSIPQTQSVKPLRPGSVDDSRSRSTKTDKSGKLSKSGLVPTQPVNRLTTESSKTGNTSKPRSAHKQQFPTNAEGGNRQSTLSAGSYKGADNTLQIDESTNHEPTSQSFTGVSLPAGPHEQTKIPNGQTGTSNGPPPTKPRDSSEQPKTAAAILIEKILAGGDEPLLPLATLLEREESRKSVEGEVKSLVAQLPLLEDFFGKSVSSATIVVSPEDEACAGHGANGMVFRAKRLDTEATVALKMVEADARTLNELFAFCRLAKVGSSSLCKFLGAYRDSSNKRIFLEMPLYGTNLQILTDKKQQKKEFFAERELLELARQMTEAVRVCHASNCVHRDIKPGNFVCVKDDDYSTIKLVDFGGAAFRLDNLHGPIGTACYCAPEVLDDEEKAYNHTVDIFSLGLTIGTLATLQVPKSSNKKVPFGSEWPYSQKLRELLETMTAEDPTKRPSLNSIQKCIGELLEAKPESEAGQKVRE